MPLIDLAVEFPDGKHVEGDVWMDDASGAWYVWRHGAWFGPGRPTIIWPGDPNY